MGASFDSPEANAAFVEKYAFPFPLLCDSQRSLGRAYLACDGPSDAYPRRITYVIGADGLIELAIDTSDPAGQADALLENL